MEIKKINVGFPGGNGGWQEPVGSLNFDCLPFFAIIKIIMISADNHRFTVPTRSSPPRLAQPGELTRKLDKKEDKWNSTTTHIYFINSFNFIFSTFIFLEESLKEKNEIIELYFVKTNTI